MLFTQIRQQLHISDSKKLHVTGVSEMNKKEEFSYSISAKTCMWLHIITYVL